MVELDYFSARCMKHAFIAVARRQMDGTYIISIYRRTPPQPKILEFVSFQDARTGMDELFENHDAH